MAAKWFNSLDTNSTTRSTGIWMSGLWSRCYLCNVCWMFQCFWAQKSQLSDFYNRRYGSTWYFLKSLMPCLSIGPKWFWTVQIVLLKVPIFLDRSNLFWSCPNHSVWVQIIKISPEKSNLNLTKMIRTQPKQFGQSKIILNL